MKFTRIISALFLICFVFAFGFAQEKESKDKNKKNQPKPVEVKVNVLVKDVSGNLVNDIKAENLKIFEDGVEQKITYFAKKEPVLNVGLVMDNTGSMRMQLETIVSIGSALVSVLRPADEAFIVRFVSSNKIQVSREWTSDKSLLDRAVGNMYIEGGQSAVIDALYLSAEMILEREKKESARRYALVLVTDAEDRDSYYKLNEMLALIQKSDVQIFVIALTRDIAIKKAKKTAENFARDLALRTGGTAHVFSEDYNKEDLAAALNAIVVELNAQYVVGYTSTNLKHDGLPRKLTVQVADGEKGEKRQGLIRESFVVPEEK